MNAILIISISLIIGAQPKILYYPAQDMAHCNIGGRLIANAFMQQLLNEGDPLAQVTYECVERK